MHFSFYMSEAPKEKYAEWKTGSGSRVSIVSALEKVQKPFTTTVSICRRDLHYIIYIAQCINTCKCKRVYIYIYMHIYIYIHRRLYRCALLHNVVYKHARGLQLPARLGI